MRYIDIAEWNRAPIAEQFGRLDWPFYSVTFRVDVTRLYAFAKANGLSIYFACIYLSMQAINALPPYLYKLRGERVALLDALSPSFTVPGEDDQFRIVTMDWLAGESIHAFCARAKALSSASGPWIPEETQESRDDLVYISCLPWLDFTSLTNERSLDRDDSIPRLNWGKMTLSDGRRTMPYCVDVNHRLIDGRHIGDFCALLQTLLDQPERSIHLP